jgi:hypothetical protein
MNVERLLTINEVSEPLRVSRCSVYQLIWSNQPGYLAHYSPGGHASVWASTGCVAV